MREDDVPRTHELTDPARRARAPARTRGREGGHPVHRDRRSPRARRGARLRHRRPARDGSDAARPAHGHGPRLRRRRRRPVHPLPAERSVPVSLYADTAGAYARYRAEDPRIAALIHAALGDARSVVNVGAGQGAYEPSDREVTAVEPEPAMIAARTRPAVQGVAEALPFPDDRFDAAMAVL